MNAGMNFVNMEWAKYGRCDFMKATWVSVRGIVSSVSKIPQGNTCPKNLHRGVAGKHTMF
jgi:hypothetical protein